MSIRKIVNVGAVALTFAGLSVSSVMAAEPTSWNGWVVDRMCSSTQKNNSNALPFAKGHTKECALTPACKKAGYALYSDGKWLNLDNKGDKMVIDTLNASKKDIGLHVHIDGQLKGDVIQVNKMTEVEK